MMSTTAAYGFQNAVFDLITGSPNGYIANISNAVGGTAIASVSVVQPTVGNTTDVKIFNAVTNKLLIDVSGDHDPRIEFQGDLDTGIGTVIISFRDTVHFNVNGTTLTNDHFSLFDTVSGTFSSCSLF